MSQLPRGTSSRGTSSSGTGSGRTAARAAKARVQGLVDGDPRVNGIGLTHADGDWAVKVNVVDEQDHPELPPTVDGVRVLVRGIGVVRLSAG